MATTFKDDPNLQKQQSEAFWHYRMDDLNSMPTFGFNGAGYAIITGLTDPVGDVEAVNIPNPTQPNTFIRVSTTRSAPDLGEVTITERMKTSIRSTLERIRQDTCRHVLIGKITNCDRPDDINGFQSIEMAIGAEMTELDKGEPQSFDENAPREYEGTFTHIGTDRLFPLQATEKADSVALAEILASIYADAVSCGTCTPYSTGCQSQFHLAKANAGSPGLSAQIVFTTDGGSTYNTDDINSLLGGSGTDLVSVGSLLMVTESTTPSHHYAVKTDVTSSVTTSTWSQVTSGYVASKGGLAATVLNPNLVLIAAQGGYIYKSTDITTGVSVVADGSLTAQSMNAIHSDGVNVVAVGNSNAILFSSNKGNTFALKTGPAVGVNLTAVWVRNATQWWVGCANGKLYYTVDGGTTWTQKVLPNQATLTYINDIAFSPDFAEHGALVAQTATSAVMFRTFFGGRIWGNGANYIGQLSGVEKYNSVALCGTGNIIAGGKVSGGTDGVIMGASE